MEVWLFSRRRRDRRHLWLALLAISSKRLDLIAGAPCRCSTLTARVSERSSWPLLRCLRSSRNSRYPVRHLRAAADLELAHLVLQHSVRVGDALVLTQMLHPG